MTACSQSDTTSRPDSRAATTAASPARTTRVDTLLALGDSIYRQSPDSARVLWSAALDGARASADSSAIARALTGLGQLARARGDFAESRHLGEQALALKLRLGLTSELARSYNALGLLAWEEERLADAAALFAKVADVGRTTGDSASLARAAINMGLVLDNLGNFADARRSLEAGRDGARAARDSVSLGRALTNIARLDIALGDPIAALVQLEAARRLFRATGDSIGEVNAIGQVATARDALGETQAAFAALDTAQRMANRLGFRPEEAENLTLIGDLFNEAGDHRHALDYYARALAVTDSLGTPEERGDILRSEARAHARLGNHRMAERRASEALRIHDAGSFRYAALADRLFLAELAQEMRRGTEAERHLQSAHAAAATLDNAVVTARVALAEARVAAGASQWARVLSVLDANPDAVRLLGSTGTADAMALRARAHGELGQLDAAVAAGAQAIAAVERLRGSYQSGELRTSYASAKSAIYVDQALLLLRLGRDAEAFRVADAARGRALLEHLATARADIRADDPSRIVLDKEQLLRRIDALVARLREPVALPRERTPASLAVTKGLSDSLIAARNEYEALVARTSDAGRSAATLLLGSGVTPVQVRARLESDEALIEYFVTPSRLLIFVITRSGLTTLESAEGASSLAARVRLARDLMQSRRGDDAAASVLRALYTAVFAPVQASAALRNVRRLVIVPHGVLTYLPFSALLDARTNEYLVERYSLLHASTAGAFVAMRSAAATTESGRAVAAVFSPFPDELPATREESRTFLVAVTPSEAHLGRTATEHRLRAALESGGIVHVATHAVMNARNPLFSRIELAGDRGSTSSDDSRLEIHELLGLRSSSPLVFLSGCETALGAAGSTPFDAAEDFTTIGQALLYAGARNVVATLWRIDDSAAAELARRFYEALGTSTVVESLAKAQRAMIADPRNRRPYLWASYQVSGAGTERILPANRRVASDKR